MGAITLLTSNVHIRSSSHHVPDFVFCSFFFQDSQQNTLKKKQKKNTGFRSKKRLACIFPQCSVLFNFHTDGASLFVCVHKGLKENKEESFLFA